jgi:hypothetical protein
MREALTSMVVVEMLMEGVDFDSRGFWELPAGRARVGKVLRALVDSGVIMNSGVRGKGKYRFTEGFMNAVSQDIVQGMPRGTFLHYPAFRVFDVCGIGRWTEAELEVYLGRLRGH